MDIERGEELGPFKKASVVGEGHVRHLQFFLLSKAGEVTAGSQSNQEAEGIRFFKLACSS